MIICYHKLFVKRSQLTFFATIKQEKLRKRVDRTKNLLYSKSIKASKETIKGIAMSNLNIKFAWIFYIPALIAIISGIFIFLIAGTPVVLLAGLFYSAFVTVILGVASLFAQENIFMIDL